MFVCSYVVYMQIRWNLLAMDIAGEFRCMCVCMNVRMNEGMYICRGV